MTDKVPFTSHELDAAVRQHMYRHRGVPGDEPGDLWCRIDDEAWPCNYIIQASITLKLTALIATFEFAPANLADIGGLNANTQKGQRR